MLRYGLPQVLILGFILFRIFLYDMGQSIQEWTKCFSWLIQKMLQVMMTVINSMTLEKQT